MSTQHLKTATAGDLFNTSENTSLAIPSERQGKSDTTRQQRVLEQVNTIKRKKSKYGTIAQNTIRNLEGSADMNGYGHRSFYLAGGGTLSGYNSSMYRVPTTRRQQTFRSGTRRINSTSSQRRIYSSNSQKDILSQPISQVNSYRDPVQMPASRSEPDLPQLNYSRTLRGAPSQRINANRRSLYSDTIRDDMIVSSQRMPVQNSRAVSSSSNIEDIAQNRFMNTVNRCIIEQAVVDSAGPTNANISFEEAVQFLDNNNEDMQLCGASFIQHACYKDETAKDELYRLGGIQKLISLIKSRNPKVQQAVAGALRNAAFKHDLNKREIFNSYGIDEALRVLNNKESTETQKQLTGLLWNLSSRDDLKSRMINVVLPSLTENVVLPFVGCPEQHIPANNKMDPEIFFNATGCLRNLSCSSEKERNAMRECRGLIDSLMSYLQACVDANRADDKSVENCACILHNLSYQLNSEVPSKLETMECSRPRNSSSRTSSSSVGCFSPRSGKISEEDVFNFNVPEDKNPEGVEWLRNTKGLETYMSLIKNSRNEATIEACAGALQNITACKSTVSDVMSDSLVHKVKGLPEFSRLLRSSNANIQKAAVSVLGNISRTPSVQKTICQQVLPDLSNMIRDTGNNPKASDDLMSTACNTFHLLAMADTGIAKRTLANGQLLTVLHDLTLRRSDPKSLKSASLLMYDLWGQKELQNLFKEKGLKKSYFVNDVATSTIKSLQKMALTNI
uniref:Plakophilin 1 n=1 Tax=Erpetoichthys calabaricus TaxID=27687 RepID=A0A8C4RLD2_ERPCA